MTESLDQADYRESEDRSGNRALARFSRKQESGSLGQVVVIASDSKDGSRVARLLRQADYHPVLVSHEVLVIGDSSMSATPPDLDTSLATLVCHRQSLGMPLPRLPGSVPGHRLIVLSDCRSESAVVQTLEAGAHHFFAIDEPETLLLARLEAALRQHFLITQQHLVVEPFTFNLQKRVVLYQGKALDLSPKEYEFAHYLFSHRGRIVTNDELMTSVWSLPPSMDTRRIDTAACRVRKKMLNVTESGWRLGRLRSVGYELKLQVLSPA